MIFEHAGTIMSLKSQANLQVQDILALITSVCSKGYDEPAHMHSLVRAFIARLYKVC